MIHEWIRDKLSDSLLQRQKISPCIAKSILACIQHKVFWLFFFILPFITAFKSLEVTETNREPSGKMLNISSYIALAWNENEIGTHGQVSFWLLPVIMSVKNISKEAFFLVQCILSLYTFMSSKVFTALAITVGITILITTCWNYEFV